jgi:hypothetical protein
LRGFRNGGRKHDQFPMPAALPAVAHLALVVWLWAITTKAQGTGAVNWGTVSTSSGK